MKKIRRFISSLLCLTIVSSIISIGTITTNAASVVENAISWAVSIANDNSHGYSQQSRWGPDYDCSSFVISAFRAAGINTGSATYTGNMKSQFTAHGFQWIPWSSIGGVGNLQRGDILLNEVQHTEIYLGNNQNVGAHSNRGYPQTGDQTGTEISVSGYYYHPWNGVLRYAGSDVCTCSTDYAGDYIVNTNSQPLNMRSAHGGGSIITQIPKGTQVYVSKSDGTWAHVEWNGHSGYCSMQYLKKIENKSYGLHTWVSDTAMGDVPSSFYTGNRYYLCYELIDLTTGKPVNETSNINYKATETIRSSSGSIFEYTYDRSNRNWISFVCNAEDTYVGTVTVSGDVGMSSGVSFEAWVNTAPQIKVWAWEDNESEETKTLDISKTAHFSYMVRDKNTQKKIGDVTTYWNQGDGYKVTVEIYDPKGVLLKTRSFNNNDCSWIDIKPISVGNYKMVVKVSGNLTGSIEYSYSIKEKEHSYGNWKITKSAACTSPGTKERVCKYCGYTETAEIAIAGHTFGSWKTVENATCVSTGREERYCTKCNYRESRLVQKIAHKYTTTVIAPTINSEGYTLHKCSVCGNSYKDNYTDKLKPDTSNIPQIVIDSKSARPGSKIDVNISLKNNPGIVGMNLDIKYDTSVLKLVSVKDGGILGTNAHKPELVSPYTLSWSNDTSTTNFSSNGVIATLTFEVKNGTKEGDYSISAYYDYSNMDIYDKNLNKINFTTVNGKISISDYLCGDVNDDGKVNNLDRVYLTRYLAKWNDYQNINLSAADVNLDGRVNNLDKVILTRYLAKWGEYPSLPYKS